MSTPEQEAKPLENGEGEGGDPSGFLTDILGSDVTVKLNSGIVFTGTLQSVDGYMNIALEGAREYLDGYAVRQYGDSFIRGNNVSYISAGKSPNLKN
ncbi:U6 snRNA-associated Sm-like protein LSm6 [Westerdykella ornata]|uniref:U6 snRNA-associated Sm-like protein LSm6 n=1 Tax=Westerdykella ornata TaxID=318751 RepID=A0A6A6JY05_WESOR|nr:U6 snRNA-associated Sm-like protein LSm6 [Westerdykella ornata]KAF2280718.1 U6 snRNA-associated Sm-like protein LSm6 [Westerdykella ornata]